MDGPFDGRQVVADPGRTSIRGLVSSACIAGELEDGVSSSTSPSRARSKIPWRNASSSSVSPPVTSPVVPDGVRP